MDLLVSGVDLPSHFGLTLSERPQRAVTALDGGFPSNPSQTPDINVVALRLVTYDMVEIPDSLRSLFTARVEERDGRYVIEVPESEIEHEAAVPGETYRVAVLPPASTAQAPSPDTETDTGLRQADREPGPPAPPVDEGEVREVTIESVGDQGDGIAKVERGYVVIVPGARPGDQPTVEIEQVKENVAFARVINGEEDQSNDTGTW